MSIDRAKALKAAQKYLAKGQIDRAIPEFEKVVALDPKDPRSLLKLGDLYTRVGDSKNAVATYRKVAVQYGADGFFLKAVAVYKQILKLDPGNLDATEKLGEMYEALALTSDAVATFEQVAEAAGRAGKDEVVLRALGRMAELEPNNVASVIRYAEALSKADRIDEAIEAFRRGADLLKQQGRIEDYVKVAERLLFHSHDDVDRARELAAMYLSRDRAKQALSHLQTCFKADPRHPTTLALLGSAFEQLGQTTKAVSVYRELSRVQAAAGKPAAELSALRRLVALEPNDNDALRRTGELEIAGTSPEELIVVEEASTVSLRPQPDAGARTADVTDDVEVARLLAECEVFERYNLRPRIVPQLLKVLELAPRHVVAREKLAAAYEHDGVTSKAVEQWVSLADSAESSAQARGYVERALVLSPGSSALQARLAQLGAGEEADDDDGVVIVDDEEQDEASFGDVRAQVDADESDDEPELVLDGDTHDADELGISDEDLVESFSEPPPAMQAFDEAPTREVVPFDEAPTREQAVPALATADADAEEETPERVSEALEEADFYLSQGLEEEAREVLVDALGDVPGHPALLAKLRSLDAQDEPAAAPEPVPTVPEPAPEEDQSFALAQKLADEATPGTPGGPIEVADVIAQFKEGVRKQVDRSDVATHYDLGIAYMEMGLHLEAIDEFKLCLDAPDKGCTAQTMIALSYVAKGDMEDAITHFKLALEHPTVTAEAEVDLWFEIGNASELLGKASEALVWYEKVEERNPTFRDVAARIERLGNIKTPTQETDEFDEMFDNMISKE